MPVRTAWINDPEIRETLAVQFPYSQASAQRWFERVSQDPTRAEFIIVLEETKEPIGFAGYTNIDWFHRKASPYIALGSRKHWGKGLGTEVVRGLLDYGFNELGFNRLYGYMLDCNPAALKMDLRAGYKQEGMLRDNVFIHGRFHDHIMLGITRAEFNADREAEKPAAGRPVENRE
jgi:RimJ/RimL family protein N-acetyltransferase